MADNRFPATDGPRPNGPKVRGRVVEVELSPDYTGDTSWTHVRFSRDTCLLAMVTSPSQNACRHLQAHAGQFRHNQYGYFPSGTALVTVPC